MKSLRIAYKPDARKKHYATEHFSYCHPFTHKKGNPEFFFGIHATLLLL